MDAIDHRPGAPGMDQQDLSGAQFEEVGPGKVLSGLLRKIKA